MKNISRREANSKITIESSDMLETYRLVKSVHLCLTGKYDYTKYGRLKPLTEESFGKESGDLKLAVRALSGICQERDRWIRACILTCYAPMVMDSDMPTAARHALYSGREDFEKVRLYLTLLNPRLLETRDIVWDVAERKFRTSVPIFEAPSFIMTQLVEICEWVLKESSVNERFFLE